MPRLFQLQSLVATGVPIMRILEFAQQSPTTSQAASSLSSKPLHVYAQCTVRMLSGGRL